MPIQKLALQNVTLPLLPHKRKAVQNFQAGINQAITAINHLIETYTQSTSNGERTRILSQIIRQIQALQQLKPDAKIAAHFMTLETVWQQALFNIAIEQRRQEALNAPITLSQFIAALTAAEGDALVQILMDPVRESMLQKLRNFHRLGDPRKEAFDVFLDSHVIEKAHAGNAQNFIILNPDTAEYEILKIELLGRYGTRVETHLRSQPSLSAVFTTNTAERPVTYVHPILHKELTGRLVVTEYCKNRDMASYSTHLGENHEQILAATVELFTQMADILIQIKAAGCAFTDMKNSNWLVDDQKRLKISDGKSFVPHNAQGEITPDIVCYKTAEMCAPELSVTPRPHNISTDKMHVYLLAKNMYCFLTGNRGALLYERGQLKQDANEFDFSLPIFATPLGTEFRDLIKTSLKKEPEDRLLTVTHVKTYIRAMASKYQHLQHKVKQAADTEPGIATTLSTIDEATEATPLTSSTKRGS